MANLAGCAASKPTKLATPETTTSVTSAAPSGGVPTGGTITAESVTIYRAQPVQHEDFELHLNTLQAQVMHTFANEDGFRAGSENWRITLRFNLRDESDDRWSRVAGTMRVTALIDDEGNDITGTVTTKSHQSSPRVTFLRSSRRTNSTWQSMEFTASPAQLPRQIRTLRGEVPMEVVSESKVFTLPLETREEELVPGIKVNLRVQPGEGASADRYRRVSMTIEQREKNVPMVRSVLLIGPDGRIRDVGGWSIEDGPDGVRRATLNLSGDIDKNGGTPVVKIDVVLAMTELTIPFEFRDIPVGARETSR
jgi:hypothetical protein